MNKIYVGIDYSMSSPAMCIDTGKVMKIINLQGRKKLHGSYQMNPFFSIDILPTPTKYANDIERYAHLSKPFYDTIMEMSEPDDTVVVMIEGYSYGSKGSSILNIAENCQTLKLRLYNEPRITLVLPSPSPKSIKKFATGNGNAGKQLMGESFFKLTKLDLTNAIPDGTWDASPVADLVDAFWISQYAKQSDKAPNETN